MRKKIMFSLTDEEFRIAVESNTNLTGICRSIGLRPQGSNYRTIKSRIARQKISIDHFIKYFPTEAIAANSIPIENLLIEGSTCNSNDLKRKLFKLNLLKSECSICGNSGEWMKMPLTLQLDHINGIHNDNRLENLRILCPNCHTQTHTHSGKRLKKAFKCSKCSTPVKTKSNRCKSCSANPVYKINWPEKEQMEILVWQKPLRELALELGVSNTSIKKFCKKHDIQTPAQGYWLKRGSA